MVGRDSVGFNLGVCLMKSLNLAARARRSSAQQWKTAIWPVFVLAVAMEGQLLRAPEL